MEKALKIHKKIYLIGDEEFGYEIYYKGRNKIKKYKFQLTKEISEKIKTFFENKKETEYEKNFFGKDSFFKKHLNRRKERIEKNIYPCLCGPCGTILRRINNTVILQFEDGKSRLFGAILKKNELEEIFLK